VTLGVVTARDGWSEACGGPCATRGLGRAFERSRVVRGFGATSISSYEERMQSREHSRSGARKNGREYPGRGLSGGEAGNTRALMPGQQPRTPESLIKRRQSRERPNPARVTAENARAVDQRRQSRKRPNLARIKAENSRAFSGCESRERPCFRLTEAKSREYPYPLLG